MPGLLLCLSQLARRLYPPGICSSGHSVLRKRIQTLSSSPLTAGACCLRDCFRSGTGAKETKWVGWFYWSFQLLVLSPDRSEVVSLVTLFKSCAYILSQFPQGAFNENTVVAGGWVGFVCFCTTTNFQTGHTYVPTGFSPCASCFMHILWFCDYVLCISTLNLVLSVARSILILSF